MKTLDKILSFIEHYCIGICMLMSLVVLLLNVILRYLFHAALSWPPEVTTYCLILTIFLGSSAGITRNAELKVDLIVELFPRATGFFDVWLNVVRFLACIIFFWAGIEVVKMEYMFHTVSPTLHFPLWIVFSLLPFVSIMFALRTILSFQTFMKNRKEAKA